MASLRVFVSIAGVAIGCWMVGCGVSAAEDPGPLPAAGSVDGGTSSPNAAPLADGAAADGAVSPIDGGVVLGVDGAASPPCTKSCGPNGTCAHGWESGQHCRCAPGFYETLSGCAPVAGSACDGVDCGPNGSCFAGPPLNAPECRCSGNTVSYGPTCAPIDKIRCVGRDGKLADKGTIRCSADDQSYEVCRDGDGNGTVEWVASGTPSCSAGSTCSACIDKKCDAGDGTGGEPCPTGTVCMSKVHEMDIYKCMPSCNCENCGTCNADQFTSGWQRSCGSNANDFFSATKACTSPCARSTDGCLPYGQFAFCFPMEGCASAPPQ